MIELTHRPTRATSHSPAPHFWSPVQFVTTVRFGYVDSYGERRAPRRNFDAMYDPQVGAWWRDWYWGDVRDD